MSDTKDFTSLNDALASVKQHELANTSRFVVVQSSKGFGNTEADQTKRYKVGWTGLQPFIILSRKILHCQHGRDKHIKMKGRLKKVDSTNAKNALKVRENIGKGKKMFRVMFPDIKDHKNHPVGECAGLSQRIDPTLKQEIHKLVQKGATNAKEMGRHLRSSVDATIPESNRRFYPVEKTIRNHMMAAAKRLHVYDDDQEGLNTHPHPSVRIKGTETTYFPVQCFDPQCADKTPHMHCPFCVKTELYTDPVILKAHYRVKHVDKGIEFAGLKVLRCCDQCDIVGVIKGEKKFKGAHWHCYKCRNGFNRRDEAIKHYKTHFRNPQTTFQIQIAQDINQPVTQGFETDEAAASIPADGFTVRSALHDHVSGYSQTVGMPVIQRGLEGSMVSMPGVGAIETVGLSDTQTIMIIQDDNMSSLQEATQDISTSDSDPGMMVTDAGHITAEEHIKQLQEQILELQRENVEKDAKIKILNDKVDVQNVKIAVYKQREQELIQQLNQTSDKSIEDMCLNLETQHRELIRQQLKQVERTVKSSSVKPTKMIIINPMAGNTGINAAASLLNSYQNNNSGGQSITVQSFSGTETASLQLPCSTASNSVDINTVVDEGAAENSEENGDAVLLNSDKESPYEVILERDFHETLENERLQIETDETSSKETNEGPDRKKMKLETGIDIECQNL